MRLGKRGRYILIFSVVMGVLFGLYQLFWFGSIVIANPSDYERIDINGKTYSASETNRLRVRPGAVEVIAHGKFKTTYREVIDVSFASVETINLPTNVLTKNDVIENLGLGSGDRYQVIDYSFLVNNYWLVVGMGPVGNNQLEGSINIYRYNTTSWELVEAGTGLDSAYMHRLGLPAEVIEYIEGLND